MTIEKEAIAKAPKGRVTRTPVTVRQRLTVRNKDEDFVYRIVNDENNSGDRIQQLKDAGYELVSGDETVGDKRVQQPTSEGSVKQISVGQGTKAYLMRIKKEWHDEDQRAKQKQVDTLEAAIKKPQEGQYGKVEISSSNKP